jgi:hypothetical protein
MDELINLARIVTDRRLKVLPLLDFNARHGVNKEMTLVNLSVDNQSRSQQQTVKELYGKNDSPSQTAFRKLKSRVQQKLLNHLFFLDESDPRHPVSRRYEQQCLSLYYQISTLQAEGEFIIAERLARKALRLAEALEFTQYAVLCGQLLRNMYADLQRPSSFHSNNKKLVANQRRLALEEEAAQIYWEAKLMLAHTVRARRTVLEKISAYSTQLEALHQKADTFTTFIYYYRTRLSQEELVGNYAEIIRLTGATARRWVQGTVNRKRFDKLYNNYMSVYAHLRNRHAATGLKLAEEYAKDFHYSSANWLYFLETYLLLALHAGQYGQAQDLLQSARRSVYYPKQRQTAQERWDLYEAYLQFVRPELSPLRMRSFNAFVQTVPGHSRDKQGYNVAVLVLQFLYYLRQRDVESLLVRLENLRKYQQRHLREAGALRSQLFFRLLAITVKSDFDPVLCQQQAEPLLKKMQAVPPPGEAFSEIEIVPYEDLWVLTLEILKTTAAQVTEENRHLVSRPIQPSDLGAVIGSDTYFGQAPKNTLVGLEDWSCRKRSFPAAPVLFACYFKLGAAVLLAADFGGVWGHGLRIAVTGEGEAVLADALSYQVFHHSFGPTLTQIFVVGGVADVVGVAGYFQAQSGRFCHQGLQTQQLGCAFLAQRGLVEVEENVVEHHLHAHVELLEGNVLDHLRVGCPGRQIEVLGVKQVAFLPHDDAVVHP